MVWNSLPFFVCQCMWWWGRNLVANNYSHLPISRSVFVTNITKIIWKQKTQGKVKIFLWNPVPWGYLLNSTVGVGMFLTKKY